MSNSLGLVDFAFGLMNSVLDLPNGQLKIFKKFKVKKNGNLQFGSSKFFLECFKMASELTAACLNGTVLKLPFLHLV